MTTKISILDILFRIASMYYVRNTRILRSLYFFFVYNDEREYWREEFYPSQRKYPD